MNIKNCLVLIIFCLALPNFFAHAQIQATSESSYQNSDLVSDQVLNYKAQVTRVVSDSVQPVAGTNISSDYQMLELTILDGAKAGQIVTAENDYAKLQKGDLVYLTDTISGSGADKIETYSVGEPYRLPTLLFFAIIFVILVLVVGGVQGLRGLLSLIGSLLLILYVLLPGILHGYSPVLVSIVVSSLIIIVGSYITHGFNRTTSAAVVGMIITVIVTGALAFWAVYMGNFTGYSTDEAVYLNMGAGGRIDIVGILLGGIMIGLLGVLYDVAIGQAVSVEELHRLSPQTDRRTIYARALRLGREHIGALVNTLAIAYVGASLPLLLLFSQSTVGDSVGFILNKEIFADQIIRTLIGSIGLVLAVPIVTLLAVLILVKKDADKISPRI